MGKVFPHTGPRLGKYCRGGENQYQRVLNEKRYGNPEKERVSEELGENPRVEVSMGGVRRTSAIKTQVRRVH